MSPNTSADTALTPEASATTDQDPGPATAAGHTASRTTAGLTDATRMILADDGAELQRWFDRFAETYVPAGHHAPDDPVPPSDLYRFLNDFVVGGPFYPGHLPPLPPDIDFVDPADHRAGRGHNATHQLRYYHT